MNKKIKHLLTLTLSTCILAAITAVSSTTSVSAQTSHTDAKAYKAGTSACLNSQIVYVDDFDKDDLFAGYVEQTFQSDNTTATFKNLNSASKLTGQNRIIYHALKSEIAKVANGTRSSTKFSIPISSLLDKTTYSATELGLSQKPSKDEIANVIENKLFHFSPRVIITALIGDCPYELYWFNRSEPTIQSWPAYEFDATIGLFFPENAKIVFQLPVNNVYATDSYTADTAKTGATVAAVTNARAIVAAALGKSDYEKLTYYCEQICKLTSYNYTAAATGAASNSDPWQMIYVFDNDPSTNVVCEGYAKAFQYLCDETVFSNANIYCYTVNGIAYSNQSYGSHMWNIVHMGSSGNYLVDVTNCDTGAVGSNNHLFLTGYTSGSIQSGYTIQIPAETFTEGNLIYTKPGSAVQYQYSDDMYSLFTAEELTLTQGGLLNPQLVRDNETHTHAYETSFYWSTNYESCTASIVCRTNPAHSVSGLACNVSSQIQVPATCTAMGTKTYTARVSYDGIEYNDTLQQELRIDPSNHSGGTSVQNAKAATADENGYTGDTYCSGCGTLLKTGTVIPAGSSSDIAEIKKGKSIRFQLSSSLDMNLVKKITYTSTKKSVVKVSKTGKITGKKAGSAIIKAKITLKNGVKKTITMKIKVK